MSVKIVLSLFCLLSLIACQHNHVLTRSEFSIANSEQAQKQALYWFTPQTFSLASNHSEELTQARLDFAKDLEKQQTDKYHQATDFSILLLAGSEGNHLLAGSEGNHLLAGSEGNHLNDKSLSLETDSFNNKVSDEQATLAQLVIVEPQQEAQIFKGSFDQGQFNFSGQEPQVSTDGKAYLLAVNEAQEIESFSGSLTLAQKSQVETDATANNFDPFNQAQSTNRLGPERSSQRSKSRAFRPAYFNKPPPPPSGFSPFDHPGFRFSEDKKPGHNRERLQRMIMYMRSRMNRRPS